MANIAVGLLVAYLGYRLFFARKKDYKNERQRYCKPEEYRHSTRYYGSHNNHDNRKRPYSSQEEAEEVIGRMRRQGLDNDGRLRAYYNYDYGKWFVGNSSS